MRWTVLNYAGGPSVTTGVLKDGNGGGVGRKVTDLKCSSAGFDHGRWGDEPRNAGGLWVIEETGNGSSSGGFRRNTTRRSP